MAGPQQNELQELDATLRELMRRAQQGDSDAYAKVLLSSMNLTCKYLAARWRGIPLENHNDVVQDVLLGVHHARATFNPELSFLAWLRAIAKNRAADYARKQKRYRTVLEEFGRQPVTFSSGGTNRMEDATTIASYLEALPPSQREAIELVRIDQLSIAEAAEHAGIGVGAMRVRVHRALKTLSAKAKSLGAP